MLYIPPENASVHEVGGNVVAHVLHADRGLVRVQEPQKGEGLPELRGDRDEQDGDFLSTDLRLLE